MKIEAEYVVPDEMVLCLSVRLTVGEAKALREEMQESPRSTTLSRIRKLELALLEAITWAESRHTADVGGGDE